jgi:hypothetical protein
MIKDMRGESLARNEQAAAAIAAAAFCIRASVVAPSGPFVAAFFQLGFIR